ncbi:hypothetical protein [Oceanomicrobium pacificus]|uniref:Secreted protein n=1 Tax=Oceanomicrobium pacificus TaxID=2692916 RepID=A0A6B0TRD0_9RHOB|nr:hypothetical protein [Oceanomicrobium pacificus]MXU63924.1 hypothetical protein [Oceanomicrobium pacificus]
MKRPSLKTAPKLACTALLGAGLLCAPAALAPVDGVAGSAAFAKDKDDKAGNSGNKGSSGNRGAGKDKDRDNRGNGNRQARSSDGDEVRPPLRPNEKGRWNASNASQKALDAHIRNQNFNGTIGALAQYQLAARAAAGEELSDAERDALGAFVMPRDSDLTDDDLAEAINDGGDGAPVFSVSSGTVSCVDNCPEDPVEKAALVAIAQAEVDALNAEREDDFLQADLDRFLLDSEQRIIDDSNKRLTPERNEDLLDGLADDLGVVRQTVANDLQEAGQEVQEGLQQAGQQVEQVGRSIGRALGNIFK